MLAFPAVLPAQEPSHPAGHDHAAHHGAPADTAFDALKARGRQYMGVDQDASAHRFDNLADGGRITLLSQTGDSADVAAIRRHFDQIRDAFSRGDFETPMLVHAGAVPGTERMRARATTVRYTFEELPRGAALRITASDPETVAAVHEFLAFQRQEHHAPGAE